MWANNRTVQSRIAPILFDSPLARRRARDALARGHRGGVLVRARIPATRCPWSRQPGCLVFRPRERARYLLSLCYGDSKSTPETD